MKSFYLALSDIKLSLRRGEALILNLLFPLVFLLLINEQTNDIEVALAFSFVLTTMSSSMTSLGISTGFERRYRVLTRLGTTPLSKLDLVFSKILMIFFVQIVYFSVLTIAAIVLGFNFQSIFLLAPLYCWLASCTLAGVALIVAGKFNLAVQNLLYFIFAGISAIPLNSTNGIYAKFAEIFPSSALHLLLRNLLDLNTFTLISLISLIAGAILSPLLASKLFSFDES